MSSQEIFGPAVGITRFSTDAEAIRIVNKLECGLSGAVHSRDVTRAVKVAQQLEINLVHINSFTLHDNAVRFLWPVDSLLLMLLTPALTGGTSWWLEE